MIIILIFVNKSPEKLNEIKHYSNPAAASAASGIAITY